MGLRMHERRLKHHEHTGSSKLQRTDLDATIPVIILLVPGLGHQLAEMLITHTTHPASESCDPTHLYCL